MTIKDFKIDIDSGTLERIESGVRRHRLPTQPVDADWQYGIPVSYMADLQDYWLQQYDWKAMENELNRYPQFIARIENVDIHFLHIKSENTDAPPLIMTHGWPGSFYEFLHIIDALTDDSGGIGFNLVIPSLPGYGFSGAPERPIGPRKTASLYNRLMTSILGYSSYYAQGGDWGSIVTAWLGFDYPETCRAIHLNMFGVGPGGDTPGQLGSMTGAPESPDEIAWAQDMGEMMAQEFAYAMTHATKFQTLGYAMSDSPMGVAAWIIEKFHGWSDLGDGTLDEAFSKQQLLTNVMIYLVTDTFSTAMWMYRGGAEEGVAFPPGQRVEVPTAFGLPPQDLIKPPPRSYAEKAYNVQHWEEFDTGGHFTAMQIPGPFVADVKKFFSALED